MHDGIGDGFAQGGHWILRQFLALELLDPVSRPGVAFDETEAVFDVGDNAIGKIFTAQHMHLARSFEQQTGDIGLIQEPRRLALSRIKLLVFACAVILAIHELLASDGWLRLPG